VEIGLHGFLNSSGYQNFAIQKRVTIFSALEVRKQGIESIMEQALEKAGDGTNAIYLSIDMDCLDQSFAPGVSAPSPAGLTSWDVLNAAFMAGKHPLVKGIDIVEISPPLDVNNLTSNIGATSILYFLGGLNERTQA